MQNAHQKSDRDIDVGFVQNSIAETGRKLDLAAAEEFWSSYSSRFGTSWKRLENYTPREIALIADEVFAETAH